MTNLRQIRERLKISQMEMAIRAGVSLFLITGIETGRREWPSLQARTRRGIAKAYGVDPDGGELIQAREPASSATS